MPNIAMIIATRTLFRQASDLTWFVQHYQNMWPQGRTFRSTRLNQLSLTVENIIWHVNHNTHLTPTELTNGETRWGLSVWFIQVKCVITSGCIVWACVLVLLNELCSLPKLSITLFILSAILSLQNLCVSCIQSEPIPRKLEDAHRVTVLPWPEIKTDKCCVWLLYF